MEFSYTKVRHKKEITELFWLTGGKFIFKKSSLELDDSSPFYTEQPESKPEPLFLGGETQTPKELSDNSFMFLSYGLEKSSQQHWSMGTSKRNMAHPLQFLPITSFCWELHFMFLPGFQKRGSRILKKQLLSGFYLFIEFKYHRTGYIGNKFWTEMEAPFSNKNQKYLKAVGFSDHFLSFLLRLLQQILSQSTNHFELAENHLPDLAVWAVGFHQVILTSWALGVLERSLGLFPPFLLEMWREKCDSILLPASAKGFLKVENPTWSQENAGKQEKQQQHLPSVGIFYSGGFFTSIPPSSQQLPSFPNVLLELSLFWMVKFPPAPNLPHIPCSRRSSLSLSEGWGVVLHTEQWIFLQHWLILAHRGVTSSISFLPAFGILQGCSAPLVTRLL